MDGQENADEALKELGVPDADLEHFDGDPKALEELAAEAVAALPVATEGSSPAARTCFITEDEVRGSEGGIQRTPKKDRKDRPGVALQVEQGSVLGWFILREANLAEQLASQAGLLYAAGQEINRLRAELARKSGGLLVPGRDV